jgi:tRNA-dihydrouridine synthase A
VCVSRLVSASALDTTVAAEGVIVTEGGGDAEGVSSSGDGSVWMTWAGAAVIAIEDDQPGLAIESARQANPLSHAARERDAYRDRLKRKQNALSLKLSSAGPKIRPSRKIDIQMLAHRFSVAPMMDWTDRHCRVFHRLLSHRARLYTEMLTSGAVVHGDRARLLAFDASEHPVALQLGGSDPAELSTSARIGEDFGYDEINFNVGCPSDRVKEGRFGACLMAEPELVAGCVAAMKRAIKIPVTVKCRIGIDAQDPEEALDKLARGVVAAGADALIVHARKAWLEGLSPKQNRDIPPLDYQRVYRLRAALPGVPIIVNGGVASIAEAKAHLAHVDGVMLGRAAYQDPWRLLDVDPELFGEAAPHATMKEAFEAMMPYIERELARGTRLHAITRHFVGAYHGVPGARAFRRHLAEHGVEAGAGIGVLRDAIALVEDRKAAAIAA